MLSPRSKVVDRARGGNRGGGIVRGIAARTMSAPPPDLDRSAAAILDAVNDSAIANSPFVVGVSGHRDLDPDQLPRLRETATRFVRELKYASDFGADTFASLSSG
jgi:hypothetical protein